LCIFTKRADPSVQLEQFKSKPAFKCQCKGPALRRHLEVVQNALAAFIHLVPENVVL